jgi:hypothetical protein
MVETPTASHSRQDPVVPQEPKRGALFYSRVAALLLWRSLLAFWQAPLRWAFGYEVGRTLDQSISEHPRMVVYLMACATSAFGTVTLIQSHTSLSLAFFLTYVWLHAEIFVQVISFLLRTVLHICRSLYDRVAGSIRLAVNDVESSVKR